MKYGVVSLFCGSGGNALGFLRARSAAGSSFESVGAFDIDPLACSDYALLTGSEAQAVDLAAISPAELASRCSRRPDVVVMSPPCKGFSGCLPEEMASLERYKKLNALALRSVDLALESWPVPPAMILLENVPRIASARGAELLGRIKVLLRGKGYEVDGRTHDCGELGGLAQRRVRYLLVARHPALAPTPLLVPPLRGHQAMASVLWPLPAPRPGSSAGGSMHRLPRLSALNWLRLAAIRAGRDWKDLPAAIGMPEDDGRQSGLYGVCDSNGQSHTVVARARAGSSSWASVSDPRLSDRTQRQNGGFGVNESREPAHAVVAEGSVRNTWSSTTDPRLGHSCRRGSLEVQQPSAPSRVVIGEEGLAKPGRLIADPRLRERAHRHDGIYGVHDPREPSHTVIAEARSGKGWAEVADDRRFEPTNVLRTSASLASRREEWGAASFVLEGPPLSLASSRPTWLVIEAPDGTYHRPLTTLELAVLQGLPAWHRAGDPRELELGAEGGGWLELAGSQAEQRERIGNAIPPATAEAIAREALEVLDAGATQRFRLSSGGLWVQHGAGVHA